ncbi:MAG: hypothetical protein GF388_07585 [Candidatus Aegiribacteria sp.]|nr:hypothetical protein [Candidatus Aegiribacteria sp.]MBD3294986.1 hypothetical protein [Candidatus Fermentibacteria bacterium]
MKNEPDLFSSTFDSSPDTRVLFLDTETTGPDPETAHVCEIALVLSSYTAFSRMPEEDIVFSSLVKPPVPVPPEASAVHHITGEMLQDEPPIEEISNNVEPLVQKADFVCAHNIPFDMTILRRQLPSVFKNVGHEKELDSLRLSRHIWPLIPSHALQVLRYRFDLDSHVSGDAHRALFDTELVRVLIEHITAKNLTECSDWQELVELSQSPLEIKVFSFGKYRGKLVEDIIARDRDYIKWLLRQNWVTSDYPDLYHTLLAKTRAGKQEQS